MVEGNLGLRRRGRGTSQYGGDIGDEAGTKASLDREEWELTPLPNHFNPFCPKVV